MSPEFEDTDEDSVGPPFSISQLLSLDYLHEGMRLWNAVRTTGAPSSLHESGIIGVSNSGILSSSNGLEAIKVADSIESLQAMYLLGVA